MIYNKSIISGSTDRKQRSSSATCVAHLASTTCYQQPAERTFISSPCESNWCSYYMARRGLEAFIVTSTQLFTSLSK